MREAKVLFILTFKVQSTEDDQNEGKRFKNVL